MLVSTLSIFPHAAERSVLSLVLVGGWGRHWLKQSRTLPLQSARGLFRLIRVDPSHHRVENRLLGLVDSSQGKVDRIRRVRFCPIGASF